MSVDYKSIDELMDRLIRNGIQISGEEQKRDLINLGYFHGYKGYRFYKYGNNRVPFNNFDEIYITTVYDSNLKSLIYSKIMFIETALKNVVLNTIMKEINSNSIDDMMREVISSYKNCDVKDTEKVKKLKQKNRFRLESKIQRSISYAYSKNNPKVTHFFNNKKENNVPLWSLFEIITMGDFGELLEGCTFDMRDKISKELGINVASDTDRELIYKYIYELKGLRNSIAHNDVIYDVRFAGKNPSKPMQRCLEQEVKLESVKFDNLGDFIILICYFLKLLKISKQEIDDFIEEFVQINLEYENSVSEEVSRKIIKKSLYKRMCILKNYV